MTRAPVALKTGIASRDRRRALSPSGRLRLKAEFGDKRLDEIGIAEIAPFRASS
jgi:hypothetical protein